MGDKYDTRLAIGFKLDKFDLERAFGTTVPEKSHTEDRYDPKTGSFVGREKVVDEPAIKLFTFNGSQMYSDLEPLICEIVKSVKVPSYGTVAYWAYGPKHDREFIIGKYLNSNTHYSSWGNVTASGEMTCKEVYDAQPFLIDLQKELNTRYGMVLDAPIIKVVTLLS